MLERSFAACCRIGFTEMRDDKTLFVLPFPPGSESRPAAAFPVSHLGARRWIRIDMFAPQWPDMTTPMAAVVLLSLSCPRYVPDQNKTPPTNRRRRVSRLPGPADLNRTAKVSGNMALAPPSDTGG